MANSPIAYIYSVKSGFKDKPDQYEELAAVWETKDSGTPFVGEGYLAHLPFYRKIVLSKVRLQRDGSQAPASGGRGGDGYGRSGGPRPQQKPQKREEPEDGEAPF